MTVKFGNPQNVPGANTPPFNLSQVNGSAISAPGQDNTDLTGNVTLIRMIAEGYLWNQATAKWERTRTPTLNFTNSGQASFTVWTPTAGKKFRLMAFLYGITSRAAAAAAVDGQCVLFDAGVGNINGTSSLVTIPAAAGPVGPPLLLVSGVLPGNGYLGAVASQALQFLMPTLNAGQGFCSVWGTEE